MTKLLYAVIGVMLGTALFIRILRRAALRLNLVDHPDERKSHEGQVPLIGGIAVFLAFSFALLFYDGAIQHLRAFAAGILVMLVTGVLDDLHELSSTKRFLAQIIAAMIMVYGGGLMLHDLGYIGWGGNLLVLGSWSVPLTVFAVVGVINALNMIDGIDGLSSMVALVALAGFVVLGWDTAALGNLSVFILLSAALFVFLLFNLFGGEHSKVFLGDSGTMFVGFVLAWGFVGLSQGNDQVFRPVTALWLFAVPLMDTVSVMCKRACKGVSPFLAGRDHIHHRLMDAGLSAHATLLVLTLVALASAAVGVAGEYYRVSDGSLFIAFLMVFGIYALTVHRAWRLLLRG